MNLVDAAALFGVMAFLAAVPSASVILVSMQAARFGLANGVSTAMGIVLGDLLFVALALAGLAVMAEALGALFSLIKYLGGLYLIWFGIVILRSRSVFSRDCPPKSSHPASFLAGLFITLGDLKAIFFYLSLFPQFVDLSELRVTDMVLICLITVVAVGGVKLIYAYAARRTAVYMHGRPVEGRTRTLAGGLMVGTGILVITKP